MSLGNLPAEFREKAETLRRDGGAEQAAIGWERAAQRLDEELTGHLEERLSLDQAVIESGYTMSSVRRMYRDGKMPMQDDRTVLRRDLPKKPGHGIAADLADAPSSRVQLARSVADGG